MTRNYIHESSERQNLPTASQGKRKTELTKTEKKSMALSDKASHETSLNWKRATDLEQMELDVKTIFVHERILPEQLIESIKKQQSSEQQLPLQEMWGQFNTKHGKEWCFYKHTNWQNRLIHGNSIEVMASLLDKEPETLEGKVQCIYFDPPFGIDFDGFRRPKDKSILQDAQGSERGDQSSTSFKAFVDSYIRIDPDGKIVKGLPVYLDGIYRICVLARRLLTDSGSIFIQISSVNLHRVALVMDEVFGEANRISIIKYKTGKTTSKTISRTGDYLLWYSKNKEGAERVFNKLYVERSRREYLLDVGSNAIGRHIDGRIRAWSQLEREHGKVPKEWELGCSGDLTSPHAGVKLQGESWPRCENCPMGQECELKKCDWHSAGGTYSKYRDKLPSIFRVRPKIESPAPSNQWSVNNPVGMDLLVSRDRVCTRISEDGKNAGVRNVRELTGEIGEKLSENTQYTFGALRSIKLYTEDPGRELTDNWEGGLVQGNRKMFVVQTPEKFIERCILMTTKPGDLVFDPTSGSGTTAVVAERLGRRWITSDAGAWQIAIARERLVTTVFDEFVLRETEEGKRLDRELDAQHGTRLSKNMTGGGPYSNRDPAQGFVYQRTRETSAGRMQHEAGGKDIPLVDRPALVKNGENCRVASTFTVERLAPYDVISRNQIAEPATITTTSRRAERKLEGLIVHGAMIEDVRDACPLEEGSILTHRCLIGGRNAALWIAQPSEMVSEYQINKAGDEAMQKGFSDLVVTAFGYEDTTRPVRPRDEGIGVWCLVLPISLTISDTEASMTTPPVLLAEPRITALTYSENKVSINVEGFLTWNPQKPNEVSGGDVGELACIMVDTNYDGLRFNAKRIQFPKVSDDLLDRDPFRKALDMQVDAYRRALDELIDPGAWKFVRSTECIPFTRPKPGGAIAVRVITVDGDTMNRVIETSELEELLVERDY